MPRPFAHVCTVLGAQAARKSTGVVVAAATEQPVSKVHRGSTQPNGFGTVRRRWPPRRGSTLQIALGPPVAVQGTLVDRETLRPLCRVSGTSFTALTPQGRLRVSGLWRV